MAKFEAMCALMGVVAGVAVADVGLEELARHAMHIMISLSGRAHSGYGWALTRPRAARRRARLAQAKRGLRRRAAVAEDGGHGGGGSAAGKTRQRVAW